MVAAIEDIDRRDSGHVFSTLVRLLGSLDAAEEALHDAFVAAAEQCRAQGVPANPEAWLVSAGRFKAIDKIRRQSRFVSWDAAPEVAEAAAAVPDEQAPTALPDYHLAPAGMADLCRRAGRIGAARAHYRTAAALAQQEPERRFMLRRLAELGGCRIFRLACRKLSKPFGYSLPADRKLMLINRPHWRTSCQSSPPILASTATAPRPCTSTKRPLAARSN